jgi:hypothetical protein
MSHTTESGAINSGAINHVRFPGAETGLALVQMIGSVSALGAISTIYIRVTTPAITTARAVGNKPAITLKQGVAAQIQAAAIPAVAVERVNVLRGAAVAPTAAGTSGVRRSLAFAATTVAQAVVAQPSIKMRILRSILSTPRAVASVSSLKNAFVYPVALAAAADVNVTALRKLIFSAQTIGGVNFAVRIALQSRIAASLLTASAIAAPATSQRKWFLSASAAPTAVGVFGVAIKILLRAAEQPQAFAFPLASGALVPRNAPGQAVASGFSNARLKLTVGASTTASFASYIVALDLNVNQRAPEERRMNVPFEERRMEVAA